MIEDYYIALFLVLVVNSAVSMLFSGKISPYMLILSLIGCALDFENLPFYLFGTIVLGLTYAIIQPDFHELRIWPIIGIIGVIGAIVYMIPLRIALMGCGVLSFVLPNFMYIKNKS